MLLTLSTTHTPATDLGYLLAKNPSRTQTFDLAFGQAHVFYPQATDERCTAALLLDIDPIGLVRNRRTPSGEGFALEQYVNDRPYVASSFLSVAISQVFGSALSGTSRHRPELANTPIPLQATLSVLPARHGGETFLRSLFEPLGYHITLTPHILDETFSDWGSSPYFTVQLQNTLPLHQLLSHLYVLIPVLDDDKHYYVDQAEVEKLLRHGEGWLPSHPQRDRIISRYLKHRRHLAREALSRLMDEDQSEPDELEETHAAQEEQVEQKLSLNDQRLSTVLAVLKTSGAKRVLDLGCNTGNLLRHLLADRQFEQIIGLDVSYRTLEIASEKLNLDRLPPAQRSRIQLLQGSLNYRDNRLAGYDAAAVIEVIEHLDEPRLKAFERVLFEFAKPKTVVITTPNIEYNPLFESLPAGKFRHKDHRFEWTRQQFQSWARSIADRFHYTVRFLPIGPEDQALGSPTQMAVFSQ